MFPIVALYAHNIDKADPVLMARPLLFSVGVVCIVYLIVKFLIHNWQKAALISSTFIILFFSYGHVAHGAFMDQWIVLFVTFRNDWFSRCNIKE